MHLEEDKIIPINKLADRLSNTPFVLWVGSAISFPPPTSSPLVPHIWKIFIEAAIDQFSDEIIIKKECELFKNVMFTNPDFLNMPFEAQILNLYSLDEKRPFNSIVNSFSRYSPNFNHLAIAKLVEKGMIRRVYTTNFDFALDSAIGIRDKDNFKFNKALWKCDPISNYPTLLFNCIGSKNNPVYVKLHGSPEFPERMGITLNLIGKGYNEVLTKLLLEDLHSEVFIIAGFAGRDIDFALFLSKHLNSLKFAKEIYWLDIKDIEEWKLEEIPVRKWISELNFHYVKEDLWTHNIFTKLAGMAGLPNELERDYYQYIDLSNLFISVHSLDKFSMLTFLGLQYLYVNKGEEAERLLSQAVSQISRNISKYLQSKVLLSFADAHGPKMKFGDIASRGKNAFEIMPTCTTFVGALWRMLFGKSEVSSKTTLTIILILLINILFAFPIYMASEIIRKKSHERRSQESIEFMKEASVFFRIMCELLVTGFMRYLLPSPTGNRNLSKLNIYGNRASIFAVNKIHKIARYSFKLANEYGQIRDEAHSTREIGRTLYLQAWNSCSEKKLWMAIAYYQSAIKIYEALGVHDGQMNSMRFCGYAFLKLSEINGKYSDEAFKLFESCFSLASDENRQYNPIEAVKALLEMSREALKCKALNDRVMKSMAKDHLVNIEDRKTYEYLSSIVDNGRLIGIGPLVP